MVASASPDQPESITVNVSKTLAGQWRWQLFDAGVEVSGGAGYDTEWEAQHDAAGAQQAYTAFSQASQFDVEQYAARLRADRPATYRRVLEALGQDAESEPKIQAVQGRACPECGMRSWLMSGRCMKGHGPFDPVDADKPAERQSPDSFRKEEPIRRIDEAPVPLEGPPRYVTWTRQSQLRREVVEETVRLLRAQLEGVSGPTQESPPLQRPLETPHRCLQSTVADLIAMPRELVTELLLVDLACRWLLSPYAASELGPEADPCRRRTGELHQQSFDHGRLRAFLAEASAPCPQCSARAVQPLVVALLRKFFL